MRNLTYCILCISAFAAALAPVACSGASDSKGSGGVGGSGATGTGGSGNVVIGSGGSAGGGGSSGKLNQTPPCNQTNGQVDGDGDGFTPAAGDCNDCTAQMNPGAYDELLVKMGLPPRTNPRAGVKTGVEGIQ